MTTYDQSEGKGSVPHLMKENCRKRNSANVTSALVCHRLVNIGVGSTEDFWGYSCTTYNISQSIPSTVVFIYQRSDGYFP